MFRCLGCPKDWKRFENSCFMSPSASFDWFSAQANCSQYNAHLATISSESENAFLIREIVSKYYQRHFWIGLKRSPFVYSVWAWVDGSPVSFTDWWPGQPDDYLSGEGCAEFYGYIGSNVHWNDLNCSKSVRFICEKGNVSTYFMFSKRWLLLSCYLTACNKKGFFPVSWMDRIE